MAQSLIPFPSTNPPKVLISRRWIAFRVIHKTGGLSWAVVDASTYELHPEASAYLHYLMGSARSTNTIRAYAQRLTAYSRHGPRFSHAALLRVDSVIPLWPYGRRHGWIFEPHCAFSGRY